jgi:hypothetical protein
VRIEPSMQVVMWWLGKLFPMLSPWYYMTTINASLPLCLYMLSKMCLLVLLDNLSIHLNSGTATDHICVVHAARMQNQGAGVICFSLITLSGSC